MRKNNMAHTVIYKQKKYTLPFPVNLKLDAEDKLIDVANPYSQEVAQLPWFAVAVYDVIKGAELIGDHSTMRRGLDWFIENFTDEYYTLLD